MEEDVKRFVIDYLNDSLSEESKPESLLKEDLHQDSLQRTEMTMELEVKFNINIPDSSVADFTTVQSVIDIVCNLIKG